VYHRLSATQLRFLGHGPTFGSGSHLIVQFYWKSSVWRRRDICKQNCEFPLHFRFSFPPFRSCVYAVRGRRELRGWKSSKCFGRYKSRRNEEVTTPCGGGLEYGSRKRRQKGNPVSNERVRYGLKFCGIWTREWQRMQGSVALVQVNYRPALMPETVTHNKKTSVWKKEGKRKINRSSQMVTWYQNRLPDWPSVVR
jgi:hypothetical protein